MTSPAPDDPPADREQRLLALVDGFVERLHAGEDPDPYEHILAHPDIAAELEEFLEGIDLLRLQRDGEPAAPAAGAASRDADPPLVGRYLIRSRLGTGASAVVYRARDPKLRRDVALKVFRWHPPAGSEFDRRFERDARVAARLRHPHIVPFHETGEDHGRRYIDMELVEGSSLEAFAGDGRAMEPRTAAELVAKVADALDYAHREGIIHRDVKPTNILIDAKGQPQLADFGLARQLNDEETLTTTGQIIGTPAYMSPEQAEGRSREADSRSDVYSLGAVLYRLLTGRPPFAGTGSFAALVSKILHEEPAPPRRLNPAVPRDLETICRKAMEKRAEDRFASAGELRDELRRWLNDEPLRIHPPSLWQRARRLARKHRLLAGVVAVAGCLLLVVGGTLGWTAYRQYRQRRDAELRESVQAEARAEIEVRALLEQARRRLRSHAAGRRDEARTLLHQIAEPRRRLPPGMTRDELDLQARSLFAATLAVHDLHYQHLPQPRDWSVSWPTVLHPNGALLVIGTHLGPIRWPLGAAPEVPDSLDVSQPRPRLASSSDGKYLVLALSDRLELWHGDAQRRITSRTIDMADGIIALGFFNNNEALCTCSSAGRLRTWSLPHLSPTETRELMMGVNGKITAAAFDGLASRVAVGHSDGQVRTFDRDGKQLREFPSARQEVEALDWSPDGRLLAVGTRDAVVQLWDVKTGAPSHRLVHAGPGISAIRFTPDGHRLLAGGRDSSMVLWDVANGQELVSGAHAPGGLSRDGLRFAAGAPGQVDFGEFLVPQAIRRFTGHRAQVERLAWSADGCFLATLDAGFETRVWEVSRGAAVAVVPLRGGQLHAGNADVALSEEGRYLACATESEVLLREVGKARTIGPWPLPSGFGRLASLGQGKFVLVREEQEAPGGPRSSVTYQLSLDGPPSQRRVLRTGRAGETGFHDHWLTPDGRTYAWVGPRQPAPACRVEAFDVPTGKPLAPHVPSGPSAYLSPCGRFLWTEGEGNFPYLRLPEGKPAGCWSRLPHAVTLDSQWVVQAQAAAGEPEGHRLRLGRWAEALPWLELADGELLVANTTAIAFSADGRFLAWAAPRGVVLVADVQAMSQELEQFEKKVCRAKFRLNRRTAGNSTAPRIFLLFFPTDSTIRVFRSRRTFAPYCKASPARPASLPAGLREAPLARNLPMFLSRWLNWQSAKTSRLSTRRSPRRHRPHLEALEDRLAPALAVTTLTPTPTGLTIQLNQPIDPEDLNLSDVENGIRGPADVTLVLKQATFMRGSTQVPVRS